VAIAAYEQWLADDSLDLSQLLQAGSDLLVQGLQPMRGTTR